MSKAGRRRRTMDDGRAVVAFVCAAFLLIGLILGSLCVHALLASRGADDAIAFTGGFGWVFLTLAAILAFHVRDREAANRNAPAIFAATAFSGFLLGMAGIVLHQSGRIAAPGVLIGFGFGFFLIYFAWLGWKGRVAARK